MKNIKKVGGRAGETGQKPFLRYNLPENHHRPKGGSPREGRLGGLGKGEGRNPRGKNDSRNRGAPPKEWTGDQKRGGEGGWGGSRTEILNGGGGGGGI